MSDTPEEIWIFNHNNREPNGWHADTCSRDCVKYIRADLVPSPTEQWEAEQRMKETK